MPCCEISDCAQMSKTIIAVRHFGLGGRESLETAVIPAIRLVYTFKQKPRDVDIFLGCLLSCTFQVSSLRNINVFIKF